MELTVTVPGKPKSTATIKVLDSIFGKEMNEGLVHQVISTRLTNERSGTKAQKNRSAVRGGGAKPWRQKGTGRARAGTIRSPLWRGGGKIFPAETRDWTQKVNKKMYRSAIRSIFSELVRQERLVVVEDFNVEKPKTSDFLNRLNALNLQDVLLILDKVDQNLHLSARNISSVDVCEVTHIDPVDLIAFEKVVVTIPALKQIEEWLK